MARRWAVHAATGALLLAGGCAAAQTSPVASAASFDLDCVGVQVTPLGPGRAEAAGCGQRAVYVQVCEDAEGERCHWIREAPQPMAQTSRADTSGGEARQVIPAPPPAPRQVQPAPPPAARKVIPAPPPSDGAPRASLTDGELDNGEEAQVPATPQEQRADQPPPEPLTEERPPQPGPTYVWIDGYWLWNSPQYVWVPGYWAVPPRRSYVYVRGRWRFHPGGYWYYRPGGWAAAGTTVVMSPLLPRPHRRVVVRRWRPRPRRTVIIRGRGRQGSVHGRVIRGPSGAGIRPSRAPASVSVLGRPRATRPTRRAKPARRSEGVRRRGTRARPRRRRR